ncbi:MAG: hypothetical protein WCO33_01115 [bacterium]
MSYTFAESDTSPLGIHPLRRENFPTRELPQKDTLASKLTTKIEDLGFAMRLEPNLTEGLKDLYLYFLDRPSIKLARKDPQIEAILEDVLVHKITHAIATVASFSSINRELTGHGLSIATALALAITVTTQIDVVDTLGEKERSLDFQLSLFSGFRDNLFQQSEINTGKKYAKLDPISYNTLLIGLNTGLLKTYRSILDKHSDSPEMKDSFVGFMRQAIESYYLCVAHEHVETPEESATLIDMILKDQAEAKYKTSSYSDAIDEEGKRFFLSHQNGAMDVNSFYIDNLTNGLKYLLATYIFFERKNLPDINQIENGNKLFELVNEASKNFGLIHLWLDDLTDWSVEKENDRSLPRNKNKTEILQQLFQAYDDAIAPLEKIGKRNRTIAKVQSMVEDLVIFFGARSMKQRDGSFQYFSELIKEKSLTRKFYSTLFRGTFIKLVPHFFPKISS